MKKFWELDLIENTGNKGFLNQDTDEYVSLNSPEGQRMLDELAQTDPNTGKIDSENNGIKELESLLKDRKDYVLSHTVHDDTTGDHGINHSENIVLIWETKGQDPLKIALKKRYSGSSSAAGISDFDRYSLSAPSIGEQINAIIQEHGQPTTVQYFTKNYSNIGSEAQIAFANVASEYLTQNLENRQIIDLPEAESSLYFTEDIIMLVIPEHISLPTRGTNNEVTMQEDRYFFRRTIKSGERIGWTYGLNGPDVDVLANEDLKFEGVTQKYHDPIYKGVKSGNLLTIDNAAIDIEERGMPHLIEDS